MHIYVYTYIYIHIHIHITKTDPRATRLVVSTLWDICEMLMWYVALVTQSMDTVIILLCLSSYQAPWV